MGSIAARVFILLSLTFQTAEWGYSAEKDQGPPSFRVGVDMVVVRVAVTDPLNRYVIGLDREHFKVFEERVEQQIIHFSNEKAPISVGIILDVSGSMASNILSARNSIMRFLRQGDNSDEFFLVTFNEHTTLAQDFTNRGQNLQNEIAIANPRGRTALFDAIYLGLEKIREAQHERKALIVITDGEDNSSRYTFSEVREFARESDVQIYVIGERGELGYGRGIINEIVRLTGGRSFFPNDFRGLDFFCDLIHTELRNQYVIGYNPSALPAGGEWRRIRVELEPPDGLPKLAIRAREGYFAPRR